MSESSQDIDLAILTALLKGINLQCILNFMILCTLELSTVISWDNTVWIWPRKRGKVYQRGLIVDLTAVGMIIRIVLICTNNLLKVNVFEYFLYIFCCTHHVGLRKYFTVFPFLYLMTWEISTCMLNEVCYWSEGFGRYQGQRHGSAEPGACLGQSGHCPQPHLRLRPGVAGESAVTLSFSAIKLHITIQFCWAECHTQLGRTVVVLDLMTIQIRE